jgi:DNA polymerase III sliding clamp (beta) subunit (PCNA family)
MFPELKEKQKSKWERIFLIEPNIDALKKLLERIKFSAKNEDESKTKSMQ